MSGRKTVTPEVIEKIKHMAQAGQNLDQISKALGRTRGSTSAIAWRFGISIPRKTTGIRRKRRTFRSTTKMTEDNKALISLVLDADIDKRKKLHMLQALL